MKNWKTVEVEGKKVVVETELTFNGVTLEVVGKRITHSEIELGDDQIRKLTRIDHADDC